MRIESIVVVLGADEADTHKSHLEPLTATYSGESKQWTISGPVYPRHLRILADLSKIATEGHNG